MFKFSLSLRIFALFFISLALSACVSNKPSTPNNSAYKMKNWEAEGKLSLKYDGKRQSANFRWENTEDNYNVRLHGPFGRGAVTLTKDGDTYRFQDGNTEMEAESLEAIMEKQLGWQLPISDMTYWIRGIRTPDAKPNYSILPSSMIQQKGWTIDYPRKTLRNGLLLPEKIVATRKGLQLTIIVKRWKVK